MPKVDNEAKPHVIYPYQEMKNSVVTCPRIGSWTKTTWVAANPSKICSYAMWHDWTANENHMQEILTNVLEYAHINRLNNSTIGLHWYSCWSIPTFLCSALATSEMCPIPTAWNHHWIIYWLSFWAICWRNPVGLGPSYWGIKLTVEINQSFWEAAANSIAETWQTSSSSCDWCIFEPVAQRQLQGDTTATFKKQTCICKLGRRHALHQTELDDYLLGGYLIKFDMIWRSYIICWSKPCHFVAGWTAFNQRRHDKMMNM